MYVFYFGFIFCTAHFYRKKVYKDVDRTRVYVGLKFISFPSCYWRWDGFQQNTDVTFLLNSIPQGRDHLVHPANFYQYFLIGLFNRPDFFWLLLNFIWDSFGNPFNFFKNAHIEHYAFTSRPWHIKSDKKPNYNLNIYSFWALMTSLN